MMAHIDVARLWVTVLGPAVEQAQVCGVLATLTPTDLQIMPLDSSKDRPSLFAVPHCHAIVLVLEWHFDWQETFRGTNHTEKCVWRRLYTCQAHWISNAVSIRICPRGIRKTAKDISFFIGHHNWSMSDHCSCIGCGNLTQTNHLSMHATEVPPDWAASAASVSLASILLDLEGLTESLAGYQLMHAPLHL